MKTIKFFFFSVLCLMAFTVNAQNYVDLGLPSGTKWKQSNEVGFYNYGEAVRLFGKRLPDKKQWEELRYSCIWTWTGNGYKVTGDNGNSIFLPAAGGRDCKENVSNVGSHGVYWSSTPEVCESCQNTDNPAWYLCFSSSEMFLDYLVGCYGFSVRLVK